MASRSFSDVQGLINQLKVVVGSFAPAGTGAVTNTKGAGFTVARTGVGAYLVTLTDRYFDLVAGGATAQLATPAGRAALVGTYDATAGTVVISVVDEAGAPADIAANANNRVNFVLWFRNSNVR